MSAISEIAPRWQSQRARFLFREINERGYDLPLASVTRDGGVEYRADLDISVWNPGDDVSGYKRVMPGDFVIGLRSFQSGLGCSPLEGLVSPAYSVLRPLRSDMVTGYFRHLLKSDVLVSRLDNIAQGIRQGRTIAVEDFNELRLPVPPAGAQRAIADYLDRETARIDALLAAKQRMVRLLDERLAIYIRHVLVSGDQPWLPLKRTWRVVDCKHRTPSYVDHGYPVISPGDATPGRLDLSRAHRFVDESEYRDLAGGDRKPKAGDIIYSRNASIGIAAFVDTEAPFCMGQDVCLISSDQASQLFLTYFLNTLGIDQLEAQKIGSTFSRVNISQILELIVPTPPPDDQRRIAQQLDETASSHRAVVGPLESQIALLQERRQSLITAAVTGQPDIPQAA